MLSTAAALGGLSLPKYVMMRIANLMGHFLMGHFLVVHYSWSITRGPLLIGYYVPKTRLLTSAKMNLKYSLGLLLWCGNNHAHDDTAD